ncbi:MAG: hypothetical protein ACYTBZ_25955 [Planctomycetota bacterium]|jgi:hypothetical protein
MLDQDRYARQDTAALNQTRQAAALVAAGLMLFFGFYWCGGLSGISESGIYNLSVGLFVRTLQFGGLAMLLSAGLCWTGWRRALLIDAVFAAIIGLLMVAEGLVWMVHNDLQGILLLIFGVVFLHSAKCGRDTYQMFAADSVGAGNSVPMGDAEDSYPDEQLDTQAKEEALKRLLAKKEKETEVQPPTAGDEEGAQAELPEASGPRGYLAELGRDDEQQ